MASNHLQLDTLTFEEAFAALNDAVQEMEQEDIPLQSLIDQYAKGTEMLKICQRRLGDAELRIEKLREDGSLEPLEPNGKSEPAPIQ
ncbi:MAG: exodeoxyribonuclease VII small subunit [Puniceicoccaceae bacterium]